MSGYVFLLIKSIILIYLNKLDEFIKINFETRIDVNKIYKKINYYILILLIFVSSLFVLSGMLLDIFMTTDIKEFVKNNKFICEIIIMVVSYILIPKIKIYDNLSFVNNRVGILLVQVFYNLSLILYMCCNSFLLLGIAKVLNSEIVLGTLSLVFGISLIKSIFDYISINKEIMNMYLFTVVIAIINITFIGFISIVNKYKISEIIAILNKYKVQGNIIFILICIVLIYILNIWLYSNMRRGIKVNAKKGIVKHNSKMSFNNNIERFIYKYLYGYKYGYLEIRLSILLGSLIISTITLNIFKEYTSIIFKGEFAILGGYLICQGIAIIVLIVLSSLDYKIEKQLVFISNYKEENYYKLIKDYTIIVLLYTLPMIIMVQAVNIKDFNIFNLITLIIIIKEAISLKVMEVLYYANLIEVDKIGRKICEFLVGFFINAIIVFEIYLFVNITNEYYLLLIQIIISTVLFYLKKFIVLKGNRKGEFKHDYIK